jgi:hypothetical protein
LEERVHYQADHYEKSDKKKNRRKFDEMERSQKVINNVNLVCRMLKVLRIVDITQMSHKKQASERARKTERQQMMGDFNI